ncbi:polysaccharide deacetylase family protein [Polynucleobacter sp. MWH-CaK5]|uniref:polysaccharide deacetylase family protein n=1 Tax=Polynucleobacter sp. MWH-CaK5 TaxID=2689107 RepID=UPI001BFCDBD9|nr:polysaccharide deacetylase family protein [Polynucleobacter sp. MWH-CaK5]QWD89163.1 polysaccharide deacetylase family protein [Polynucleobacter sp. MWH-CaK5]
MKFLLKELFKKVPFLIFFYRLLNRTAYLLLELWRLIESWLIKNTQPSAIILLYHRVAEVKSDPAKLAVTPICFEQHIIFLKKNYEVISLEELIERCQSNSLVGKEAVITFDDGYQDNLNVALPLLEKYQVPATIFVTTGMIGEVPNFQWSADCLSEDQPRYLTSDELVFLANHPLISIGGHTKNHARLSDLNFIDQYDEISSNKKHLEEIIGKDVNLFAYPYGRFFDYDHNSVRIARQLNFICSAENMPGLITSKSDLFRLPRFNVRNYTIDELSRLVFHER